LIHLEYIMAISYVEITEDSDADNASATSPYDPESPPWPVPAASLKRKHRPDPTSSSSSNSTASTIIIGGADDKPDIKRFARSMSLVNTMPASRRDLRASTKPARSSRTNNREAPTKQLGDYFRATKPAKDQNSDSAKVTIDLSSDDETDGIQVINRAFLRTASASTQRANGLRALNDPPPIIIDSDDDVDSATSVTPPSTETPSIGNTISADDAMSDADLRKWLRNVAVVAEQERKASLSVREVVDCHKGSHNGRPFTCAAGKAVQLEDGSFLRIQNVLRDGTGQIFLSGKHLVRQNLLGPKWPKHRNEVVWMVQHIGKDTPQGQSYEVELSAVRKNREVVFTSHRHPDVSSRTDGDSYRDRDQDFEVGPLFCRWKMTVIKGPRDNIIEEVIEHLRAQDADDKERYDRNGIKIHTRVEDERSRYVWRGVAHKAGGSHEVIQRVYNLDGEPELSKTSHYTFGDAFCGAGGASRGALDAGLFVKWGFDKDNQAIQSYYLNFSPSGTDCHEESVDVFYRRVKDDPPMVEVLHVSPPCQPFSHAHTIPSLEKDETNQAAMFSVWSLIETIKPRIVTLEETDGLVTRHKDWFSALISSFICHGYSVRWTTLRCEKYGVPQMRKRLVIVAAG
jgi:DNA (cytosine-5)-methyltransferase 1